MKSSKCSRSIKYEGILIVTLSLLKSQQNRAMRFCREVVDLEKWETYLIECCKIIRLKRSMNCATHIVDVSFAQSDVKLVIFVITESRTTINFADF